MSEDSASRKSPTLVNILATVGFPSALMVGAFAVSKDVEEFGKLVTVIGLPSAVTMVAVWFFIQHMNNNSQRSSDREDRMEKKIDMLEDKYRTELVSLIKAQIASLDKNTDAFHEMHTAINDLHELSNQHHQATIQFLMRLQKQSSELDFSQLPPIVRAAASAAPVPIIPAEVEKSK